MIKATLRAAVRAQVRIEVHMGDDELIAVNALLERLLIANYGANPGLLMLLADADEVMAADMLSGACLIHAAARRVMRDRNMPEAA
ncbi:hypothetical protein H0A66_08750 [Alcaligenaceae bacterium]|nr:hypothetical protein [Alcaligenaceae bacterium]